MSSQDPHVGETATPPAGTPSSGGPRGMLNNILPDLAPWRSSHDFRIVLTSSLVTNFGAYFTYIAVPLQIMEITGSPLAVGLVGAVQLVPMIVFGLWGGALADSFSRRRLIIGTEIGLAVMTTVLLANSLLPKPQLWPLYVFAALVAMLDSVQRPALDALTPQVVPHDQLPAASALQSLRRKVGAILSPAIAGLIAATAGVSVAYVVDLLTFALSLLLLSRLRKLPPPEGAEPPSLRAIATGVRYAWSRKDLLGTYLVDIIAMAFAYPVAIFPFLVQELEVPWALGMLYSAPAVGAVTVSLTSGWYSRVHRHGRMVIFAAAATGAAFAVAGLSHNIWLVLFFLAVAGGADMISGLGRDTMWNQSIPDELRGRMAGVELLSYSVGPKLGDVRAGWAASNWGAMGSIWTGGVACLVGVAALAAGLPKMLAYDDRTNEHAQAVRANREASKAARISTT